MGSSIKVTGVACSINCVYCLSGDTPVLGADMTWKKIEDIKIGDVLVGFDENTEKGKNRQYRPSVVLNTMSREVNAFRVVTDKGEVTCSADHPWLVGSRWRTTSKIKPGQKIKWVSSPVVEPKEDYDYKLGYFIGVSVGDAMVGNWKDRERWRQYRYRLALKDKEILNRVESYLCDLGFEMDRRVVQVGQSLQALQTSKKGQVLEIQEVMKKWEETPSFLKGYLAGIYDAEGGDNGGSMRIFNSDRAIIDRVKSALDYFGFRYKVEKYSKSGVMAVRIAGGISEKIRFFATVKPACKRKISWDGIALTGSATVREIVPVGKITTYDLTTTTSTFVAGGFASHNCYEGNLRKETSNVVDYDLDKIMKAMEERKGKDGSGAPTLHGGEALMIPKSHVETLLKKMYELYGSSGVQTNGIHIDDDYIEMFKKYNTHVGISFDGPWPLNKLRVAGNGMSTKVATEKTYKAIYDLKKAGISVGLIMVLHRANASKERIGQLKEFILEMDELGVTGRLNLCIIDDPILKRKQELTEDEAAEAYEDLARFLLIEHNHLKWQPFRDIVDNLLGNGLGTCIFHPCSYYEADAERVIMGDGTLANCLKTAKTNKVYLREPEQEKNHVREDILSKVPYEYGGCKGCRFWRICYGVCPSEGIDGDWRNRSRYCKAYYRAYEVAEQALRGLLPNIQLVIDREPDGKDWYEDYKIRSSYRYPHNPFELMTPQGSRMPSSWRGGAVSMAIKKCPNCGCHPSKGCKCGAQQPKIQTQQEGWRHADHTDHQGQRQTQRQDDGWHHADRPHGDSIRHSDSG